VLLITCERASSSIRRFPPLCLRLRTVMVSVLRVRRTRTRRLCRLEDAVPSAAQCKNTYHVRRWFSSTDLINRSRGLGAILTWCTNARGPTPTPGVRSISTWKLMGGSQAERMQPAAWCGVPCRRKNQFDLESGHTHRLMVTRIEARRGITPSGARIVRWGSRGVFPSP
jgi:hypothetical protein